MNTMQNDAYADEAKQRYGNTEAYKQSQERFSQMSKEDLQAVQDENEAINRAMAAAMPFGPESDEAQTVVARHYAWLGNFYEPTLVMYKGLADMYVDDPRFAAQYERHRVGMARFMRDAMHAFVRKNTA